MSESDISTFCDWLEGNGLHQYYWHFARLVEIGRLDDEVHRAAKAAEAVGLANLAELVANAVLQEQGGRVRGNTLSVKLARDRSPGQGRAPGKAAERL